ncbi:MAG: hydroxymethylbilane synthase [Thermoleophilia bacterium]
MSGTKGSSIILGTRGSELAMYQARHVAWILQSKNVDLSVKIKTIMTTGDKILDTPLAKVGDKGLFVKEIENELLSGEIDIAVHSCKDLPTELPAGLTIAAFGAREDARDAFIGKPGTGKRGLSDIVTGGTIGTSSLRRRSQLKSLRPDLVIVDIRGNVDTRIRKIQELKLDGTVLATAGIKRLERLGEASFFFDIDEMIPAVGQGVIAIESREDDPVVRGLLSSFNDSGSAAAVTAERALMKQLEGGCQVPIGAYANVMGDRLSMKAYLGSLDGKKFIRDEIEGPVEEAGELGVRLAVRMYAAGGREILEEVRAGA